jgi:hypothetical protein
LIEKQVAGDIGFEQFHLYDTYIPGTIERPDKSYESTEDDEKIRTYVRTYSERSGFHQVVIGVVLDDKQNSADVFVPIICFVSREKDVVKDFCHGTALNSPVLN